MEGVDSFLKKSQSGVTPAKIAKESTPGNSDSWNRCNPTLVAREKGNFQHRTEDGGGGPALRAVALVLAVLRDHRGLSRAFVKRQSCMGALYPEPT